MAELFFPTVGDFYGSTLTDAECERLLIERFGAGDRAFKKHFKKELQLYQTKWFDYRLLHPVVATYLYAAEFQRTFKKYYAKTIDHEKAQYMKGFSGGDAWAAKNSGGFIKGRQQADLMGIPYWFYIERAYEWLYRKKWKHIPRQTHLYSEEVIQFVAEEWRIYSTESLVIAEQDFFRDRTNQERPEYQAHQQWLRDRVALSRVPEIARESLNERGYYF